MSDRSRGNMERTLLLSEWMREAGFVTPHAAAAARAALESAGITRSGKTGMSSAKEDLALRALDAALARYCGADACRDQLKAGRREIVVVARHACDVCGGSNVRRELRNMVATCTATGTDRLVIVGGTPATRDSLREELADSGIDLRIVLGNEPAPSQRDALNDCAWADLVVIWAPTPLPHKVSTLYTSGLCDSDRVHVHRRGIEALAAAIVSHLTTARGTRVRR